MSSDSMDRRLALVTCSHCGAIYDLTRRAEWQGEAGAPEPRQSLERAPAALPEGFSMHRVGAKIRISWRWFRPAVIFMLFFVIAWDSFLVAWYATALGSEDTELISLIFPITHVAVGVGLTYATAAGFLNRTTVTADGQQLKIRHSPLPWFPAPTLPVTAVEQLYITRKVKRSEDRTTVRYELRAVTRKHRGVRLLGGLDSLDQALYLEQVLEDTLGIIDRPVASEHRDGGDQL